MHAQACPHADFRAMLAIDVRRRRELPVIMTRGEVARALGVSRCRVQQWQADGRLHPRKNEDGVWLFDRYEVVELEKARARTIGRAGITGELAARAFRCFREGWTLAQVVEELEQTPETVRKLHAEWRSMQSAEPSESGVRIPYAEDEMGASVEEWAEARRRQRRRASGF